MCSNKAGKSLLRCFTVRGLKISPVIVNNTDSGKP